MSAIRKPGDVISELVANCSKFVPGLPGFILSLKCSTTGNVPRGMKAGLFGKPEDVP